MFVTREIKYSIGDIIEELGETASIDGVIAVKMSDKLFLGGGCETPIKKEPGYDENFIAPQNISICVSGPIL